MFNPFRLVDELIGQQGPLPPYLFKFRNWENDYHKLLLTDGEAYFASPQEFNDPFDCRIPIRYEDGTEDEFFRIINDHLREINPELNESQLIEATEKRHREEPWKSPESVDSIRRKFDAYYNKFGIFSLSETFENILLWSHYANGHKGFCVGFDVEKLSTVFSDPRLSGDQPGKLLRVAYPSDNEYPYFNPRQKSLLHCCLEGLRTKSKTWHYEREWRMTLVKGEPRKHRLSNGVISHVILGSAMNENSQVEIMETVSKFEWPIKLLKAKKSEDGFWLEFESI